MIGRFSLFAIAAVAALLTASASGLAGFSEDAAGNVPAVWEERDPVPDDLRAGVAALEAGDVETARAVFSAAAVRGAPVALYYLGIMALKGLGEEKNPAKAADLLERAAKAGLAADPPDGYTYRKALYRLGRLAETGTGVPKNLDRAECLYRASAENGYAAGQWQYSRVGIAKPGIAPSDIEFQIHLERSAAQGFVHALAREGFLESISPRVDMAEGFMMMLVAASKGNDYAKSLIEEAETYDDYDTMRALIDARERASNWRVEIESPPSRSGVPSYFDCGS